ncbi:MAG: hypothetical protein AAF570_28185, partial [Bacteroidota bacterium]
MVPVADTPLKLTPCPIQPPKSTPDMAAPSKTALSSVASTMVAAEKFLLAVKSTFAICAFVKIHRSKFVPANGARAGKRLPVKSADTNEAFSKRVVSTDAFGLINEAPRMCAFSNEAPRNIELCNFTLSMVEREKLVFMLWGAFAQKKAALIDGNKHLILKSPHPSPFSAHKGFFGNKH